MKNKNVGGFTVVELLITLIVVGIVFVSFTTTFAGVMNISKKGSDVALASQTAFAKLQEYENLNFTSLPTTTPSGTLVLINPDSTNFTASLPSILGSPRTGQIYVNTVSPTLKQVLVRVTFGSGPTQRLIEYTTFIQKQGLGR